MAQVSYDLDSQIFGTFLIRSQKCFTLGESPDLKHIEKTHLQEYDFSQNLFA
jgi:hypothetical protein